VEERASEASMDVGPEGNGKEWDRVAALNIHKVMRGQ